MEILLQVPMLEKLKRVSPILVALALVQLGLSGVTKLVGVWPSPRLVGLEDPILKGLGIDPMLGALLLGSSFDGLPRIPMLQGLLLDPRLDGCELLDPRS
jgi:hypothetical protein